MPYSWNFSVHDHPHGELAWLTSSEHSPVLARWIASRDEEQAVSVKTQGPVNPKLKDSLPTKNGAVLPVLAAAAVSCN